MTIRLYFAKHSTDDSFIGVEHGEQGYFPTTVYTQDHADALNERQGHTPAQVRAAVVCSMFDCWVNFDRIVKDTA